MMERAIKERDLRYLVLDEVIHFVNSTTPVIYYGDFLKSLSNCSGFNLLLPEAYGSEEIIHASGQLARRIKIIHYPRYKDNEKYYTEYATFVKSCANKLPCQFEVDLTNDVEYLFSGSFGGVGTSVDILQQAAANCVRGRHSKWSRESLRKAMPSLKAKKEMAREVL